MSNIQEAYVEAIKIKGLSKDKIKQFMLAGRAILTVQNILTKNRFTFKIKKLESEKKRAPEMPDLYFINVLTGPDNTRAYSFVGTLYENLRFKYSGKSRITEDAKSIIMFKWFIQHLANKTLPDYISVFHEGKCGKCGRALTVPESIQSGFGPECSAKLS
jgi:hypothetical protein